MGNAEEKEEEKDFVGGFNRTTTVLLSVSYFSVSVSVSVSVFVCVCVCLFVSACLYVPFVCCR